MSRELASAKVQAQPHLRTIAHPLEIGIHRRELTDAHLARHVRVSIEQRLEMRSSLPGVRLA